MNNKKLNIIFIRHGMTHGNQQKRYIGTTDEALCPEGLSYLKNKKVPAIDRLHISPAYRCRETASILYPALLPVIIENFRECDFGLFENKNYLELQDNMAYQSWLDSGGTMAFPGGEDPQVFKRRCLKAFERIIASQQCSGRTENLGFIVHGGTVMSILETYGRPLGSFYDWHCDNGCGYHLLLDLSNWQNGKKELILKDKV